MPTYPISIDQYTRRVESQYASWALQRPLVRPLQGGAAEAGTRAQIPCLLPPTRSKASKKCVSKSPYLAGGFDFECFYRTYARSVFTQCLRMVGDRSEAEDLVHESFLQLFRKLDTFRGEAAFRTWLFRLVTNVVLMYLRKKRRLVRRESSLQEDTDQGERNLALQRALGVSDQAVTGTIDRVILERALQGGAAGPPGWYFFSTTCRALSTPRLRRCCAGRSAAPSHNSIEPAAACASYYARSGRSWEGERCLGTILLNLA
jgi:RNA polymerase sigma factor (sigma-70 family)